MIVESLIITSGSRDNGGVVGLVGLDENLGVLVTAVGTADDLADEVKSAFFAAEVGEGELAVGLNDAKSGEEW